MTASDALTESGLGNKLGALTQVWSFFDPEHRGYVESSGLSDVLCSRLGSVEPSNMQALMGRLNPNNEPRIGFPAFAAGLQSWLSDHGAGLPSPLAPLDINRENVGNKENMPAFAQPPLKLQMLANAPFTESSPSKQSLRKMCADLESELAAKHEELDTSRTTILSLLETGQAESPAPAPLPAPAMAAPQLRASTSLTTSLNRRSADIFEARNSSDDGHLQVISDQAQQLRSRDKIIAELRSRQQAIIEQLEEVTGDAKRLREQVKADRRLREQHTQLLTAGRAARDLAEAHAHRAATLEEELISLKNKVKHEQSKNSFSKEQKRVWETKLASKDVMLERLHATLSALHQQHTEVVQCVVVSAANARSLSLAAAEKSAVIADVNLTVSRLTAEMGALQSRSSELATQLAEQSSAREAAQATAETAGRQLLELVTTKGLKDTLSRAAAADYWEGKFGEAMEHAARERNVTALKVQRVSHEYAQLQKQLVAAHEDQAVSAALLHRLMARGATLAADDSSQEGDGGVSKVGGRRSSALDPLRSSQEPRVPERRKRADALAADVASIRERIRTLRSSYTAEEPAGIII